MRTVIALVVAVATCSTSKENFDIKLAAVKGKLWVNCGFWGGVVPESVAELPELLDAGVLGVKSFLIHSGIDEFPQMTAAGPEYVDPATHQAVGRAGHAGSEHQESA